MSVEHALAATKPHAITMDDLQEEAPARLAVRGMCLSIEQRVILDDVSFDIASGEVFGLLGPNGAGKTSLMRCLTGLARPDRGTVWLDGKPVGARDRSLRAQMGVVFQEPSLDPRLTARENLELGAVMFGVGGQEARQRAGELLTFMGLEDRGADPTSRLSGGMRRRLELARALIHRPTVLVLDEPTAGLDFTAFERTWQRLLALRRLRGLTLLVSSHNAQEALRCDRLLVFDRGHVVACDTPEALLRRCCGDIITVEAKQAQQVADAIVDAFGLRARVVGDAVIVEAQAGHMLVPRLVETFEPGRLLAVQLRRPTLADAFYKLTGCELEAAAGGGER